MTFWRKIAMKWKLTLIFVIAMLIPIILLSLSMTGIMKGGFVLEYQRSKENIIRLANNVAELSTTDVHRSIAMLDRNRELIAAITAPDKPGKARRIEQVLKAAIQELPTDLLEIITPEGEVLVGVYNSEAGRQVTLPEDVRQLALQGGRAISIVTYNDNTIAYRVITDLKDKTETIALIRAEMCIGEHFAQQIAAITGEEIVLLRGETPVSASSESFQTAFQHLFSANSTDADFEKIVYADIDGVDRALMAAPFRAYADQPFATLGIGLSTATLHAIEHQSRGTILTIAGVLIVVMSLLVFGIASVMTRPLTQLTEIAEALGRGETPHTIPAIKSHDEIGKLARAFRSVIDYFQVMTQAATRIATGDLSQEITPVSPNDRLGEAFQDMMVYLNNMAFLASTVADGDLTHVPDVRSDEDTFGQVLRSMTEGLRDLIVQIQNSAEQIAAIESGISSLIADDMEIVQNVHAAVQKMVTTIREIGDSIEDVASKMETLSSSVDETSGSVEQMTGSIAHIAFNTEELTQQTNNTSAFLDETVTALEKIVKNTDSSKELSQGTIEKALKGQEAIEQVTSSMETLQQTISTAVEAMSSFSQRSQDIGTILDVIRNITEQTTLLALNASIIAAQAGSHGRGFAVVANEIKGLADGVATSTKDIGAIVKTLQQEAGAIVRTIHKGADNVKQSMERTLQARNTLGTIISSAKESSKVVTEISDDLHDLMSNSQDISASMKQVKNLMNEINSATTEQKSSTIQINKAVVQLNDLASHIQQSATYQSAGLQDMLSMTNEVVSLIDQNYESSQRIMQVTEELAMQAGGLLTSIDRFTLHA